MNRCTLIGQQYDTLRGEWEGKNGKKNREVFVFHTSLRESFLGETH